MAMFEVRIRDFAPRLIVVCHIAFKYDIKVALRISEFRSQGSVSSFLF